MKVDGTFETLVEIWQFVAKYTIKSLLCQGVDGDIAMAKNSRRVFADATCPAKQLSGTHIAFDDKCKLITTDKAALYVPPAPRAQFVALANWESAPTFVLDDHLDKDFPKASTDRLLNKCNPFLSGKRRALSDDISSEAPTVSTDCSTILEEDELDVVNEEENVIDEEKPSERTSDRSDANAEQSPTQCEPTVTALQTDTVEAEPKKQKTRWVCAGYSRYVKSEGEEATKVCPPHKTETSWTVRWVQVGYCRYEKFYTNGEELEKAAPTS